MVAELYVEAVEKVYTPVCNDKCTCLGVQTIGSVESGGKGKSQTGQDCGEKQARHGELGHLSDYCLYYSN